MATAVLEERPAALQDAHVQGADHGARRRHGRILHARDRDGDATTKSARSAHVSLTLHRKFRPLREWRARRELTEKKLMFARAGAPVYAVRRVWSRCARSSSAARVGWWEVQRVRLGTGPLRRVKEGQTNEKMRDR